VLERIRGTTAGYPRPFWILFWGSLVNSAGTGMVWPFLTIYVRELLQIPLTTVTLLFSFNSVAGLVAMAFVGPAVDRFGRKRAMVLGLAANCLVLLSMSRAQAWIAWAVLMALWGALGPLYRVGADAMVADLTAPERRAGAYSLLRIASNLGVAIGPAIGGFVASASYAVAFYFASGAQALFAVLVGRGTRETLPSRVGASGGELPPASRSGYGPVFRDRRFLLFCGIFTVASMPSALMMMLLAVYAKENFRVPESQYGLIMATNATMVVLFQYAVTRASAPYRPLYVLAVGALLYGVGTGSVALGQSFWGFWTSMVILTIGELLLAPTGTAFAANLAPAEMRGRYMGLYGLTWGVSFGIAPVIGGWLNDNVAPVAIWYAGMAMGLAAALGFLAMARSAGEARPARIVT
jgi:MFS family permease